MKLKSLFSILMIAFLLLPSVSMWQGIDRFDDIALLSLGDLDTETEKGNEKENNADENEDKLPSPLFSFTFLLSSTHHLVKSFAPHPVAFSSEITLPPPELS